MKLHEIMASSIETIDASATVQAAALKMKRANVGMLPVFDTGKLVGVVTDRDLVLRALSRGKADLAVRDAMSPRPVCIDQDQEIEEAIRDMEGHRVGRLLVEDDSGHLVGVLTASDVAVACAGDERVGKLANALAAPRRRVGLPAAIEK